MERLSNCLRVAILATLVLAVPYAWADKEEKVHSGLVVSATADSLVMTDSAGKNEHAHKVGPGAAITVDGKPAKLAELKKGDKVQVALGQDGKVTRIAVVTRDGK
jgi:hypothetical protein